MVLIFGLGYNGKYAFDFIRDRLGIEDVILCDNSNEKVGKEYRGIKIMSFMEAVKYKDNISMIIITIENSINFDNVYIQCLQGGFDKKLIYYFKTKSEEICVADKKYVMDSFSQDGEELYLREIFSGKNNGTYVDVGAFHPCRFSNTAWAYLKGWHGINIEPNPDNIKLFEYLRPNDININCGISQKKGELLYYMFDEPACNTFDTASVEEVKKYYRLIDKKSIKMRMISDILKENNINHVDFMDIDVESYEMDVLETIDFSAVEIDYFLIEQRGVSLQDVISSDIAKYLSDKGYIAINKFDRTVIYKCTKTVCFDES